MIETDIVERRLLLTRTVTRLKDVVGAWWSGWLSQGGPAKKDLSFRCFVIDFHVYFYLSKPLSLIKNL
jgi:hypothetical protein